MFGFDAPVVHVEEFTSHKCADNGAYAVGNKRQTDLGHAKAVVLLEKGRHGGDAHLPDGVVDGEEQDDGSSAFADEDAKWPREVNMLLLCQRRSGFAIPLDLRSVLVDDKGIPSNRIRARPTPIANNRPQRLREEENKQEKKDTAVNGQEPEDGPPSHRSRQGTPNNRANSNRSKQSRLEDSHEPTPLGTGGNVANDTGPNRNRARAPGALQTPQHDEGGIVLGLGQPDARAEEDDKSAAVGNPTPLNVGQGAPEAGCYALEDEVGCHCEVDELDRDVEIAGNGREGGEVDV